MLNITQLDSASSAKEYYFSGNRLDYYAGAQEKPGLWGGKVAEKMGLKGVVKKEHFAALCDHINPATGEQLTARKNANYKVGYDLCFGPPKSVSIVHALTGDENIRLAVEGAFTDTMQQMEQDALTRKRTHGAQSDRHTGNILWAQFTHQYSRPTERDGRVLPDPHLHPHAVLFNVTYDPVEKKWKALQLGDIKRDAKYFEACMHSRLIRRLQKLGYDIQVSPNGWEIEGIAKETIEKFSQRTKEIEEARIEEEKLLGKELTAIQKAQLGRRTRKLKNEAEQLSELDLKQCWRDRLTKDELKVVQECFHQAKLNVLNNLPAGNHELEKKLARAAVDFSVFHNFETNSVMDRRKLMVEAIKESYGNADLETVEQAFNESDLLTYEEDKRTWCTTKQVRDEERRFIKFAREGRLQHQPIIRNPDLSKAAGLSDQQTLAYLHVLTSRDGMIGIRGKAGTGKTTMMEKIVKGIEQSGQHVYTFAPTAGAVEVLKKEGFDNANTIQHFLLNEELQQEVNGSVLWVDEAGLISSRQMAQLTQISEEQNCRIVLSGDTGQHSGVERGDALRILETHGGLRPAQLDQIFRQKDPIYNDAVRHLAEGKIAKAFEKFEQLGSIQELRDVDRPQRLADEYLKSLGAGRSALIVSPTHHEGLEVTTHIRRELIKTGKLYGIPKKYIRLQSTHWSSAQRAQFRNYQTGLFIEPHAAIDRKLPIGKRAKVVEIDSKDIWVENHQGKRVPLNLSKAENFNVYEEKDFNVMTGDKIRINRIGRSLEGKKLATGTIDEVRDIKANGDIVLKDGQTLPADFGHFSHGYCVTSHSSQGRTVDDVLIAESSDSFPAASLEQFYVSCSRGRERLRIFTDDKEELKRAISRSCARKSAHDNDWDAQSQLQSKHFSNLQNVARGSQLWTENFGEQLATPATAKPIPEKLMPEPALPDLSDIPEPTPLPQPSNQPSIDIGR